MEKEQRHYLTDMTERKAKIQIKKHKIQTKGSDLRQKWGKVKLTTPWLQTAGSPRQDTGWISRCPIR